MTRIRTVHAACACNVHACASANSICASHSLIYAYSQVQDALRSLGFSPTEKTVNQLIDDLDTDGDGQIS